MTSSRTPSSESSSAEITPVRSLPAAQWNTAGSRVRASTVTHLRDRLAREVDHPEVEVGEARADAARA